MEQIGLVWEPEKLSVKQITAKLRRSLREQFSNLYVTGEVSALKTATSGHIYFNLKEEDTVLSCVIYRQSARLLRFPLKDGLMVLSRGSIDVYEPRGVYQFLVEHMEPLGAGALQVAFEQLKKKLETEGLFAASRKRALPKFPRHIGIVTSPSGAVIQDMLNVFARRSPGLEIQVYPALVQGPACAEQVTAGIRHFSESGWADVVIVARGGGSFEDLCGFNEELVAREIAACAVPVVSAVGHETDFTIADFVADLRAPTPSAAAEIVAPDIAATIRQIEGCERAMTRCLRHGLSDRRERLLRHGVDRAYALLQRRFNRFAQRLDEQEGHITDLSRSRIWQLKMRFQSATLGLAAKDHKVTFLQRWERIARFEGAMRERIQALLAPKHRRLESLSGQLLQLNPTSVLERGFAIVRLDDGTIVRRPEQAANKSKLRVRVAGGEFRAVTAKAAAGKE